MTTPTESPADPFDNWESGRNWLAPVSPESIKFNPEEKATVTRKGALDMQVCVPNSWPDEKVKQWAEQENPSGTSGWHIRREGDPALAGGPERNPCSDLASNVHIMLDA